MDWTNSWEKYISAELQKCSLGESAIMNGTRSCTGINSANTIDAAVEIMTDKNPYKSAEKAVRDGGANTSDTDVGYISLGSPSTSQTVWTSR